ncbi:LamG domain-containing protein, partial [bacterium]|nr:LamG domain-containing protein [bacterium]
MFGAKNLFLAAASAKDALFNYVTMLLHGDGTNGAQNNTFLDSSTNNFNITRNGNTTQGSFSPYGTLWSNYFTGSSTYLSIASSAAFGFGTGDFTIEYWVNPALTGDTNQVVVDARPSDTGTPWLIGHTTAGAVRYYDGTTVRTGGTMSANTWNHVAWTRSGGVNQVFLNGVQVSTYTASQDFGASRGLTIGSNVILTSERFVGYASNLRIIKGTAVYTSAFTPPTTPLTAISGTSLLTCQSNRFIDNSTNNFAITVTGTPSVQRFSPFSPTAAYSTSVIGGSGYFDGSGDYLAAPSNAALALGTGDYTVECWVYATSTPSDMGIYEGRSNGVTADGFTLTAFSSSVIRIFSGGVLISSTNTGYINQWAHVAVTRASGTTTLWINGISQGTSATSYNCTNTDAIVGGGRYGSSAAVTSYFPGYISNFRIVK